jgi:hypothetical protein
MDIAIDFDGTYAADPDTFANVVGVFRAAGHRVVIVTNRTSGGQWGDSVRRVVNGGSATSRLLPIVFAGDTGETKYHAARRHGYNIQIWIDDNPGTIGGSHVLEKTQWITR